MLDGLVARKVSVYVRLSKACIVTKRKKDIRLYCPDFLYHTKDHLA